jgi:hypothetical protein
VRRAGLAAGAAQGDAPAPPSRAAARTGHLHRTGRDGVEARLGSRNANEFAAAFFLPRARLMVGLCDDIHSHVEGLALPHELLRLIASERWPALKRNPVPRELIQAFAPDEEEMWFYPPPFQTAATSKARGDRFWDYRTSVVHEIVPERTVILGDFGQGSDAPVALDYRASASRKIAAWPRVIRLKWSAGGHDNHWVEVAPDFESFGRLLRWL